VLYRKVQGTGYQCRRIEEWRVVRGDEQLVEITVCIYINIRS
jgi:hypothetical protein